MTEVIFARTRWEYGSYADFWRLVEVSGFKTCFVDQIDLNTQATYIFTPLNGEVIPHLKNFPKERPGKVIWWNLERPLAKGENDIAFKESLNEALSYVDECWVSDLFCASQDRRFKYVLLAGHGNYGVRSDEKLYDICHLSYLWGRRSNTINLLSPYFKIAPNAYGKEEQQEIVSKSKLMLSLHQYEESPLLAPIRLAIAASYAIPFITEKFPMVEDLVRREIVFAAESIDILSNEFPLKAYCLNKEGLKRAGDTLFNRLCLETNFKAEVLKAV
jgi:hypothetical protein